jgi:Hint domain
MTGTASATISVTQIDPTDWKYSITLTDTSTTPIGTFWFAWVPGKDFLDTSPNTITNPAGWTNMITHFGSSDGYAIQWKTSSSFLAGDSSLSGFSFVSSDAPSAVFSNSNFFPTPATTSVVYAGAPLSDAGFTFVATETACFLPGTHILTDRGEVAVEALRMGDRIVTRSGQTRPLCWIGHGRALAARGRRSAATPVIIRKGALGPNVPNRDLHVTKGHALFLDGVLIPVEFLVNHRSILWDDRAQEVVVYHLELDAHDVLMANGAPAESYRDDGNRWLFQNANSGWDLPPKAPCAPVLTGGPVVDAVWRRLLDRSGPRPGVPLTDDPDLHLLVDGVRVDASMPVDGVYVFGVGDAVGEVRIVSDSVVPQEVGLARDPRRLGVAVRRIVVRQGSRFRTFLADDARLEAGFHAVEADRRLRWTDGDAALPGELFAGFAGPFEVVVQVGGTTRYIDGVSVVRRAA